MRLGAKLQKISENNKLIWDKTFWAQPILQLQLTPKMKLTYMLDK